MKILLMLGAAGAVYYFAFGKPQFRRRCDGTVNDPYCQQNSWLFGPYSSGGKMVQ